MIERHVFVLDDDDGFRGSVEWLLESLGHRVHAFAVPEALYEALERLEPGDDACVLLDVRMPGDSGLEVHERMLELDHHVPVIYMTGHADVPLAVEAMRKGASTFLEKPLHHEALQLALDHALNVESPRLRQRRHDCAERIRTDRAIASLTPREREILDLIMDDKTNKEIARAIDISLKTVEMHRARVMRKLDVRSAAQLVRRVYAWRAR